jgi:hypothetical protein
MGEPSPWCGCGSSGLSPGADAGGAYLPACAPPIHHDMWEPQALAKVRACVRVRACAPEGECTPVSSTCPGRSSTRAHTTGPLKMSSSRKYL